MGNKYTYLVGGLMVIAFLGAVYWYASNHREYARFMIAF